MCSFSVYFKIMLSEIRVSNFRSVRNARISLCFNEGKAPNGWKQKGMIPFVCATQEKSGRICTVLAAFGENGSGKSSFFEAAKMLVELVKNGVEERPSVKLAEEISERGKALGIEIAFTAEGKMFRYACSFLPGVVHGESLSCDSIELYRAQNGKFEKGAIRALTTPELFNRIYRLKCLAADGTQKSLFLTAFRSAAPRLSAEIEIAAWTIEEKFVFLEKSISPENAFDKVLEIVKDQSIAVRKVGGLFQDVTGSWVEIAFGSQKQDPEVKPAGLMRRFSLALARNVPQTAPSTEAFALVYKSNTGKSFVRPLARESEGIRRIFIATCMAVYALETGATLFADDLDEQMHCLVPAGFVRQFKSKTTNTNAAQLVFSMKSAEVLAGGQLSRSEVAVLTLDADRSTQVRRLSDFRGLRNANEFRRRYVRGDFGGVPGSCTCA